MRWIVLLLALAGSVVLSLILSAILHTFIFFAFIPLLFVPFAFGRRRLR